MRLISLLVLLAACEGPAGPAGPQGDQGSQGSQGDTGATGDAGPRGEAGLGTWFTQPGVAVAVTDLTFAQGSATVSFTLTDGSGTPLDASGRLTDGAVATSFVLAQLAENADGSPAQYTAYTTQQVMSGSGATATQPQAESTGTLTTVDVAKGTYTYAFAAPTTGIESTLTQTVGALAVRTPASGTEVIANATFSARPDGGTTISRQEVTDTTCNSCHKALSMHGGRWTSTDQCILCHQPQSSDPYTGNTLDFKVMVHMIHDGSSLPSVVAGTPYQIVGYMRSVNDFSTVVFPQNIERCAACHAGAQGTRWETTPTMAACTSCHDLTSFVQPAPTGMTLHSGGPLANNSECTVCHPATGSIAGIADMHLTGLLSPTATTVALSIQSMTNTGPGQTPTMTFTALVNGAPADLVDSPWTGITATIAGPTTDNATYWQATIQGTNAVGTLTAVDQASGVYSYAFPASAAIPATATGSYSVGLEGFLQPTSSSPRYAAVNPVLAFAVTDPTPVPRRTIVSLDNCNGCHYSLSAHGGSRTNPQYCVFCHNPSTYDSAGAPRFEASTNVVVEALDFRHMLHKVHAGTQLTEPYVIGGYPLPSASNPGGTPYNFAADRYPAPLAYCQACHTDTAWQLPMDSSPAYAPTTSALMSCAPAAGSNASAYCPSPYWTVTSTSSLAPQTSVCTSCHDAPSTLAHAQLETTPAGVEACVTCHGSGAIEDVGAIHGQL
jgi:OmcA/MtrC family decaheme c-type cytochrome